LILAFSLIILRAKDRTNTTLSKLPADEPAYVSVVTLFELHCGANITIIGKSIVRLKPATIKLLGSVGLFQGL